MTPLAPGTANITVVGYGSDGNSATETSPSMSPPPRNRGRRRRRPAPARRPPATAAPHPKPRGDPASAPDAGDHSVGPDLTARGSLPVSVVAGQKARIQQTVSLIDSSKAVAQAERLSLSLSTTTTGSPGISPSRAFRRRSTSRLGKQARLTLSTKQLNASVPAGPYHVLVSVTDPNGSKSTVDTGQTLSSGPRNPSPTRNRSDADASGPGGGTIRGPPSEPGP